MFSYERHPSVLGTCRTETVSFGLLYSAFVERRSFFYHTRIMKRALRLGITGKIASGKTLLSQWLREQDITVLDADTIAKEVMEENAEVRSELITLFSPAVFADNKLDTKYLAGELFNNSEKRLAVEAIVHPLVIEAFDRAFQEAPAGSVVGVESALMFQTGFDDDFDIVILVTASDDQIIERNHTSKRFTETDLRSRLVIQDFSKEMEDWADFVIENSGTKEAFVSRASTIIDIIKIIASGDLPEDPMRVFEEESDPQ